VQICGIIAGGCADQRADVWLNQCQAPQPQPLDLEGSAGAGSAHTAVLASTVESCYR
jgi:hypothetical protein